jgi:predicted lipoprotein with Yx(FWY)xxD motif
MTGTKGMTLYYWDQDKAGKSTCNATCAQNWPPLLAGTDARPVGNFTVITRDDGTKQWAYKGRPLYYSKRDENPGEMMGESVNGWHAISP